MEAPLQFIQELGPLGPLILMMIGILFALGYFVWRVHFRGEKVGRVKARMSTPDSLLRLQLEVKRRTVRDGPPEVDLILRGPMFMELSELDAAGARELARLIDRTLQRLAR